MLALCTLLALGQGRIVLESPAEMQVFQRDGRDRGRIVVRGRWEGAGGETLEVRLSGGKAKGEWKPLTIDPRVPAFASEIDAPAGGWFRLETRLKKGALVVAEGAVGKVGVGELFVLAGQSNAANHAEAKMKPATDRVVACDGASWRVAEDPQAGATGNGGSIIPPLGDLLVERLNVPVGFFPVAVGATSVREWAPPGVAFDRPPTLVGNVRFVGAGQFESTGKLYRALADRLALAGPAGVRAVLWHQGESDANQKDSSRTLSGTDYRRILEEIIRASWRDGGRETPWFVARATYHTPDDKKSDEIRAAQEAVGKTLALPGPDTDALDGANRDNGGKGVHFSAKGQQAHAKAWAEAIGPWLTRQTGETWPGRRGPGVVSMAPGGRYRQHAMDRPRPPVVTPPEPGKAPSDAIVLFDGKDLSAWKTEKPREGKDTAPWKVADGIFEIVPRTGPIVSREAFANCQIHIEYRPPAEVTGRGQGRGNSGFFLVGHPEIQVLDSFENDTYPDGQAAAIYGHYPPLVNANRKPGEWNTYDIIYMAPILDARGKVVRKARYTVFHNGLLAHHDVEVPGSAVACPILLQDHNNPVGYRNIWVRPARDYDRP
jgi:hypothetical protein